MTERDKIIAAWQKAPPHDFARKGSLYMPEPVDPPVTPLAADAEPTSESVDQIIFDMEFKGGVRSAIRIIGRLRDTAHTVHFERH